MDKATKFPYITQSNFSSAISSLHCLYQRNQSSIIESGQDPWLSVDIIQQHGIKYLRVTKSLSTHTRGQDSSQGRSEQAGEPSQSSSFPSDVEVEVANHDGQDEDEQTISHRKRPEPPLILYDVVFSLTYSVPVLYFSVKDVAHRYPPTMHVLYDHIIQQGFAEQTKEGYGILGGVTIADHPITNQPVYLLHPCKTAEVLQASNSSLGHDRECDQIDHLSYLVMWIGAMGKCVGLNVPLALAMAIREEDEGGQQGRIERKASYEVL